MGYPGEMASPGNLAQGVGLPLRYAGPPGHQPQAPPSILFAAIAHVWHALLEWQAVAKIWQQLPRAKYCIATLLAPSSAQGLSSVW